MERIVIAPRGSAHAYEHWIVPRTHAHDVGEPHELASLLQSAARASWKISPSACSARGVIISRFRCASVQPLRTP